MSNPLYVIRNYQPADFEKFVWLNIEAEKLEPTGRSVSSQLIDEHLSRPNYSPEQDLLVIEIGSNIIGYTEVTPELTIGRVILNCWVHPEHRRIGLATKLFSYSMQRTRELGAKIVHVNIAEDNVAGKSALTALGFNFVRRFLELRLDIAELGWHDVTQSAIGCRHLIPGEEDKLARIQNRSFAGTWGYNLNTVEEIAYCIRLMHCSPEDILLTFDGDRVIGYCWTGTANEGGMAIDERRGRLFMLGVDPDYRGRGVGKRVLMAGLAHLKSKGLTVAELTVDSENKAAYNLYLSAGFEVKASSLWYEKVVA